MPLDALWDLWGPWDASLFRLGQTLRHSNFTLHPSPFTLHNPLDRPTRLY